MKRFRKLLPIGLALALILTLFTGTAVLAQPPTEVNVDWDGAGWVGVNVDTGGALAGVSTGGDYISGSYSAVDSNNNPYGYGVDNFSSTLNAYVANGVIDAGVFRTDSTGMYGPAGQESWSYVFVEGGSAAMAYRSTTNYAQMTDGSYGYQLPGGHNIVADAAYYELHRGILDGLGDSGALNAWGSGTAELGCMVSGASGVWSLTLGRGGGCYTDASYVATGGGHFDVTGTGMNSVTFNGLGITAGGPSSLGIVADFVNGFSIGDYSLTAN